ncbi:MAG: SpoIIE family protein phosphatase [Opitutaceae bacterium]|nr:SpoIIE family protein phosphatase [Opitutaceae bacterium]
MSGDGLKFREGAEFELLPNLAFVERMLREMQRYLKELGFPEEDWPQLQLAVAECLNNAIIHGCSDQPDAIIRFRWAWTGEGLTVQVRDPGEFTPPEDWNELPEDPLAESGRGGYLISQYFEHIRHENNERGHEITLTKKISHQPLPPNIAAVEDELQMMTQDLSDSYESLAAMFNISALLATSKTFDEFLRNVLGRLRNLLSNDLVYARIQQTSGEWTIYFDRQEESISPPLAVLSAIEEKVWEDRKFISHDRARELPSDDPLQQWEAGLMLGPISFQGTPIGLLVTGRRRGQAFTAGQTNLLRTIADFVGVAYTTAELYRQREEQMRELRELEIAAQIQQSLLPTTFPAHEQWEIDGVCESARAVGGDFFDAIVSPTGHILVLIADVMGKGVPAAMLSSLLRASARARLDLAHDPARLLTELNRLLAGDLAALDMFITVQIVSLSPEGDSMQVANAGHSELLGFTVPAATAHEIASDGDIPLGVMPDTPYRNTKVQVTTGQVICLLTDGLYEVEDSSGEMLGFEKLATLLPTWWTGDLTTFPSACLAHLKLLQRDQQSDDRTLVAIRRKPLSS